MSKVIVNQMIANQIIANQITKSTINVLEVNATMCVRTCIPRKKWTDTSPEGVMNTTAKVLPGQAILLIFVHSSFCLHEQSFKPLIKNGVIIDFL